MRFTGMFLVLSAMLFFAVSAWAQDPTKVAPDNYKQLFENDRVRVQHVYVKVDAKIPTHSHPDHLAYALSSCTISITGPDGKPETASVKEGDVIWFDAVTHSAHNVGTTECHLLVVELKEPRTK